MNIEVTIQRRQFRVKDIDLRVPEFGRFGVVKHDYQLAEYDFKPRQLALSVRYALPQNRKTRPMFNNAVYDYVRVPEAHQWFLWDLFRFALEDRIPVGKIEAETYVKIIKGFPTTFNTYTEGSLTEAYGNMIERSRDFTDGQAVEDGFADYPTGRHIGKPPWQWRCITHGGNLVKILREWNGYYVIEAINLNAPPPKVEDVFYKPWLIQWATEITTNQLADKRWVVSRFPQIREACRKNGLPEMGTPFPLWSLNGENMIAKDYVIPVANGAKFSPYVPEK